MSRPRGGAASRRGAGRAGTVAVFVTAHGYGHMARACALVQALYRLRPDLRYLFLGEVPRWFLGDSLPGVAWDLHTLAVDVGPVQRTSLRVDLEATRARIRSRVPFSEDLLRSAVAVLEESGARVVVSDIAVGGILAGTRLGLPTVLVESFTWDWIYRRLQPGDSLLAAAADWLERVYAEVTLRIQPRPCCEPRADTLQVGALARSPRHGRARTRAELGVADHEVMALLSMGGVPWRYRGLKAVRGTDLRPVVVGEAPGPEAAGIVHLAHRSRFHHPDLVAAADVVVGKLGYSTLAEAWQSGCAYLYVERQGFPETPVLEAHAARVMPTGAVTAAELEDGRWVSAAQSLASRTSPRVDWEDGAEAAAEAVVALL